MKLFKVDNPISCPYRMPGGGYCGHLEGPILCPKDNQFPDDCPGEDVEEGKNGISRD